MTCRLAGAKPVSEPMLEYCWFDHWEQTSMKSLSKLIHFCSRKCICKCRLENGGHLSRPQCVKVRKVCTENRFSVNKRMPFWHWHHSTQWPQSEYTMTNQACGIWICRLSCQYDGYIGLHLVNLRYFLFICICLLSKCPCHLSKSNVLHI